LAYCRPKRARSQDDQRHKAVAQSFSHVVRALYFGSLSGVGDVPIWTTGPAILLAIGGTSLVPFVLERMTDHGFRQWTRAIIFAISGVYLAHGGWLLWHRSEIGIFAPDGRREDAVASRHFPSAACVATSRSHRPA